MPSTLMVTREPSKVFYGSFMVNRPDDLSLFHSLLWKNNVILECNGVWQTCTVSHG